ncbi:hypothetical protein EUTSA_v10023088mg [Eutrema salsugineum]|uniref:Uncharacterized protein n=1 Tax=Eutrema salsugineum TaxID=72664 RepID=V4NV22_EUTSA|nr:hypothetical protein EUTSA_v10023088mg [Eutrema salsugineum]
MKSAILFIASCVFMILVLSYPNEVKAAPKRCHYTRRFRGTCGNDMNEGSKLCLGNFHKMNLLKYDLCGCVGGFPWPRDLPVRICNCSRPC